MKVGISITELSEDESAATTRRLAEINGRLSTPFASIADAYAAQISYEIEDCVARIHAERVQMLEPLGSALISLPAEEQLKQIDNLIASASAAGQDTTTLEEFKAQLERTTV